MVLSSAFWSIFIVILILALLYFLRERKIGFQGNIRGSNLAAVHALAVRFVAATAPASASGAPPASAAASSERAKDEDGRR